MRRFILAAAIAAATASAAFSPALADSAYNANPGVNTIGVDVTGITLNQEGVSQYLSSLSPEARKSVESACQTYSAPMNQGALDVQTQLFCAQVPAV